MLMDGRADLLYPTTYVVIEVGEEAEPYMPAASTLLVGDGSPGAPIFTASSLNHSLQLRTSSSRAAASRLASSREG